MTPKEKAKELVCKFDKAVNTHTNIPLKRCVLITVDEMINEYQFMSDLESVLVVNNEITFVVDKLKYWNEVKKEIWLIT